MAPAVKTMFSYGNLFWQWEVRNPRSKYKYKVTSTSTNMFVTINKTKEAYFPISINYTNQYIVYCIIFWHIPYVPDSTVCSITASIQNKLDRAFRSELNIVQIYVFFRHTCSYIQYKSSGGRYRVTNVCVQDLTEIKRQ